MNIKNIPFIDLNRTEAGFKERVLERWEKSLEEFSFFAGQGVQDLTSKFKNLTGVNNFIPCANGTDALQLALRASNIGAGDYVIVPELTFWASVEAIYNVSAKPIFIDINPQDLQLDFELTEQAILKHKPKAIILVHLYGWCSARLADFRELAKKHNIKLIEDGAQALGTKYNNQDIFAGADIITTSFYPAKVLGASGDAGAICSQNSEFANICNSLANHGRQAHYGYSHIGWNSRMNELQACFLAEAINYFPQRIQSRLDILEKYNNINNNKFSLLQPPAETQQNGYLQVSLSNSPDSSEIQNKLKSLGINTGKVYPSVMSSQPALSNNSDLIIISPNKIAEDICQRVFNLPLFPYMTNDEINYIISSSGEC